jgi:hypothetical protein
MPAGRSYATDAASASSANVFALSGEPFTRAPPSTYSMSSGLASSMWAARRCALSLIF